MLVIGDRNEVLKIAQRQPRNIHRRSLSSSATLGVSASIDLKDAISLLSLNSTTTGGYVTLVRLTVSVYLTLFLLATTGLSAEREDVNAVGPDGTTALHWAVRANDLQKVESLIRAGAKVNVSD